MSVPDQPVCECSDFQCDALLSIDWPEYHEAHPRGILISHRCTNQYNPVYDMLIERRPTYTIVAIIQTKGTQC